MVWTLCQLPCMRFLLFLAPPQARYRVLHTIGFPHVSAALVVGDQGSSMMGFTHSPCPQRGAVFLGSSSSIRLHSTHATCVKACSKLLHHHAHTDNNKRKKNTTFSQNQKRPKREIGPHRCDHLCACVCVRVASQRCMFEKGRGRRPVRFSPRERTTPMRRKREGKTLETEASDNTSRTKSTRTVAQLHNEDRQKKPSKTAQLPRTPSLTHQAQQAKETHTNTATKDYLVVAFPAGIR